MSGLGRGLGIRRPQNRPWEDEARDRIESVQERPPEVSWDDFLGFYFRWNQGEHVTMIGPTGRGKTTLALAILPLRQFVMAIATKQRDPVLYQLESRGYQRITSIRDTPPKEAIPRIVLEAKLPKGAESVADQRRIVKEALAYVYIQGGWCLYLDEVRYVTEFLKLDSDVELLWQQGRSAGISVVAAAQRPAWVPLSAFSMATHLFLWRTSDERDLERIGGLGAFDSRAIAREVATLGRHSVLYVNTVEGILVRTQAPKT
jgi:hypothetical protein